MRSDHGPPGRPAPAGPDPSAWCRCDLGSRDGPDGEVVVVHVVGELDLLAAPMLVSVLDRALARIPRHLVVDLAGVGFCGVRGLSVLAGTADTASARDIGYEVRGLAPRHHQILSLLDGPGRRTAVTARGLTSDTRPGR